MPRGLSCATAQKWHEYNTYINRLAMDIHMCSELENPPTSL